jgi:PAS domain S-box-containing protein
VEEKMIPFQRLSIGNKLALALVAMALLAFAAASAGLALYGQLTLKSRARKIMEPYAHLISVGTETAVAFEDPKRAREILDTLKTSSQILKAEIVLRDGRLLAGYNRANATFHPHPLKPDGIYLNDDNAELLQSLGDGAHLHLVMSLDEIHRQVRGIMLVFSTGLFVLLVATTLGLRLTLHKTIVRPISNLAGTVEKVSAKADYSQRVPVSGFDEVARLGQSFNVMMEVILERADELRRLTHFQRAILDNAAHGIFSAAPDGIVSSFNPASERLLGYKAQEVVGKLTPVYWHDPEEIARRAFQLSDDLGETVMPGFDVLTARPRRNLPEEKEWTFIRKDGTHVPVLLSVSVLRNERGQVTGFVGLTYDITERKRAEEEIRILNQELEQRVAERTAELETKSVELQESQGALMNIVEDLNEKTAELEEANSKLKEVDRLKSMFIASMSHELRTPLNSIIGFSSIMLNEWIGSLNPEQKQNMAAVLRSGKHLLSLINDVIDVSKIEAGKIDSIVEEFDVYEMVLEAVETLKKDIEEKGLELTVHACRHVLHTDRRRLLQCLLNLLSNATKFTMKGSINVSVEPSEDGSMLTIAVEDTGIGISENDLGGLFSPFVRLHAIGECIIPGTGLGLYLTQKLLTEILNGDILVTSTYGVGSRFTILVPTDI